MLTSVSSAMLAEFGSKWRVCTEGPGDVTSSFRAALSRGRAYCGRCWGQGSSQGSSELLFGLFSDRLLNSQG